MNLIHVIHRHERLRIDFHHEIHQSTELMLRHDRDDLRVLLEIVGADRLIERRTADLADDELPDLLAVVLRHDADALLDRLTEDEVVEDDPVEVGAEQTEHHRLRVIGERTGEGNDDARSGHGLPELDMKILIQQLRDDIEPSGGSIVVKQDTAADRHDDAVRYDVECCIAGERSVVREQQLEQTENQRQDDRGIGGFEAKFLSEHRIADDQQDAVHDHRELRDAERHEVLQHDGKTRDARHRRMARHQEEKDRSGDDRARNGHQQEILQDQTIREILFHTFPFHDSGRTCASHPQAA